MGSEYFPGRIQTEILSLFITAPRVQDRDLYMEFRSLLCKSVVQLLPSMWEGLGSSPTTIKSRGHVPHAQMFSDLGVPANLTFLEFHILIPHAWNLAASSRGLQIPSTASVPHLSKRKAYSSLTV